MPTSNFQPIRLLDPHCCYKSAYLMAKSADPDQLASTDLDLYYLQNRVYPGSEGQGLKCLPSDLIIMYHRPTTPQTWDKHWDTGRNRKNTRQADRETENERTVEAVVKDKRSRREKLKIQEGRMFVYQSRYPASEFSFHHWTNYHFFFFFFVLRFYGPVNPMGSCRARSVYLTTRLLGRLSPLSD